MAKLGELRWDELEKSDEEYTHEPTALWAADQYGGGKEGVDPLNEGKPILAKGEVPPRPSNEEVAAYILKGADLQWKDKDHLHKEIVSQDQADQLQKDWDNKLNNIYEAAQTPIIPKEEQTKEWGSGESFNKSLTDEERIKRNMYTGD